jgi:hypothetical protein
LEPTNETTTLKTDTKGAKIRQLIKAAMERGELDNEPELAIDRSHDGKRDTMDWEETNEGTRHKNTKKQKGVRDKETRGVSEDEFFVGPEDDED